MAAAGLIYGCEPHYIDHLAPLCALLEIPLILTDSTLAEQARLFYPDLNILFWNPHETPEKLVQGFDAILYSTPRVLFEEDFFFAQYLHKKVIRTIWCPHGNSDKGRNSPFFEALKGESLLLVYGNRMEKLLREKGVTSPTFQIGNYRLQYYKKHKKFYEQLFPTRQHQTILYAPTWQDGEKNSSFPDIWPYLLQVPKEFSLLVKLHPHLYKQFPKEIQHLEISGIHCIKDFPPIYPILAKVNLYLGDMSSIGYDFLACKKPLVLLTKSELTKVGRYVPRQEFPKIFEICKEEMGKKPKSSFLYQETFGVKPLDISALHTCIIHTKRTTNVSYTHSDSRIGF